MKQILRFVREHLIWLWRPSKNLGCLGVRFTPWFYADCFRVPYWGVFINVGRQRIWINLEARRIHVGD